MKAPANQGEEADPDREPAGDLGRRAFLGRRDQQPRHRGDGHHTGGETEQRGRQRRGAGPQQEHGNRAKPGRERGAAGGQEQDHHFRHELKLSA